MSVHRDDNGSVVSNLGVDMVEIALNDLAFASLNAVDTPLSENQAEAIDRLAERIRQGTLAISVSLLEIAQAIREGHGARD